LNDCFKAYFFNFFFNFFMKNSLKYLILTIFASILFHFCKNDHAQHKSNPVENSSELTVGHRRMIAILDSIAKNANPMDIYSLNSRKADLILAQLNQITDPSKRLTFQFSYGEQLLYAGKTKDALKIFEEVIAAVGDDLATETKIIYEMYALAWLRLGEQQNCIQNHSASSCILPISGSGIHQLPEGSTKAATIYERILKTFPEDLQTRWLLNIAYQTLGKYPRSVPTPYLVPPSLFKGDNSLKFNEIATKMGLDMRGLSGGVCMEDFNNDGFLDVFCTGYGLREQCKLFWNKGDGTFVDGTESANLTGIVSGLNTIHADYNNDGFRDIFILRGGWLDGGTHPNSLLKNNGNGTFTDVTIDAKILSFHPTQTAVWGDFDGDGWLDLFIGNEAKRNGPPHLCEFFHNKKDGTFEEISAKIGLNNRAFVKAVGAGDINDDGLLDIYISELGTPNKLFVNRGGLKFEEISQKAGVTKPEFSFPTWFWDFDNDGLTDIFVSGYDPKMFATSAGNVLSSLLGKLPTDDNAKLFKNNGNETFTDVTEKMGVNKLTFAMGSNFGDLDNDGFSDYYLGTGTPDFRSLVPNRMFKNEDGTRFREVSMSGFAHIQKGHGVAFGDLDNDGDQDIYEVMGGAYEGDVANNLLFENPGNQNHWLTLALEGQNGVNRDAIGAKIIVKYLKNNGKIAQTVAIIGTGGSFGSASLQAEIGLGDAKSIESVSIRWPKAGLEPQILTNISMDNFYKIKTGDAAELVARTKITMTGGNMMNHEHHH
jgi:FG-GAP-like repeat/ASPIC and UnbV